MKYGVCLSLALLSVLSSAAQAQPSGFERCAVCHTVTGTSGEQGPSLLGIVGRAAGSLEDFRYSRPMTRSGITWDETTLNDFLRAPDELVPGTRMPFEGIESDAERAAIIEYLKTLK
jgi:cytochrome c